jgi:heme-degrading monooxygenase HmoA
MFERYTDEARRSLFFARYEVTQLGGLTIEPEHLVLGVLRAAPQSILRFISGTANAVSLRTALERAAAIGGKISTSVEIPFSPACKSALEQTPLEADAAKNVWIAPVHIVLGVMVRTEGAAARILAEAGLTAAAIREHLATVPEEPHSAAAEGRRSVPGMISREWKGVVRPGKADEYLTHLRRETLPALARLDGFVTASILRREVEDGTEFEIVTIWRALAAIELFAGADVTRAVVPPAVQAFMVRYDKHAVHYEIVQ